MSTKTRIGIFIGLGLSALTLGLCLVWINLELVSLSYSIREVHGRLEHRKELKAKLQVEHMNVLSSSRLREKAAEMGLHPPRSGQVRSLE